MSASDAQTGKSIVRNALYGFSTWAVPLVLSFVATPIIVGALGNEDYGIYALVLGIIGYSFNFNFGKAITKFVAEHRAKGELERINGTITASLILNVVIGGVGAIALCVSAGWLVAEVFRIEPGAADRIVHGIWLASAIIFVTMLNQICNSVLQGLQRFDLFSRLANLYILVLLAGNAALALAGYGMIGLLVWNLITVTLILLIGVYVCYRLLPGFRFELGTHEGSVSSIVYFSAGVIGCQILSNALLLFERGYVVRKFGAEELTYYVVPMMLAVSVHGFVASLMLVVFPLASELAEQPEKLRALYRQGIKASLLVVSFVIFSTIAVGSDFLSLWMGRQFSVNASVLLVLHVLSFCLLAVEAASWQMTEGLGYPSYNFAAVVALFVIATGLMLYLSADYGSEGIAAGRLAGSLVLFASVFFVEWRFLSGVDLGSWLKFLGLFVPAGIVAGALEYGISAALPDGWPVLFLSVAAGGAAYCGLLWLVGAFTEKEMALLRGIFAR